MKSIIRYSRWIITILLFVSFFMQQCYYDSEENLFPSESKCDSTNVTYSVSVTNIINNSCISCHNNSNASGGISLENYSGVKAQADNGKLMGTVTFASGYLAMPQGSSKLDDCSIATLQKWVDSGAPNN